MLDINLLKEVLNDIKNNIKHNLIKIRYSKYFNYIIFFIVIVIIFIMSINTKTSVRINPKDKYYKVIYYIDRSILNSWEAKGEINNVLNTEIYYFYDARTNGKIIIVSPKGTIIAEEFDGNEYKQ